jgi:hypothetical protein
MVALDAMQDLASVCPGSVREVVTHVAASCPSSNLVYAPVTSLSACSRTSWIGNPELYAALQTNGKLKALGVELRAACSPADAQLEVRHNLDLTVEWTWQLKSKQGEVLSSGRVIAFQGKDVGAKITGQAIKQIATTTPGSTRIADGGASSPTLAIAPRTIRVVWLPYDFQQHDTQLTLYVDSERVRAQDSRRRVVFDFPIQEFRDARLTREWEQPFQLGFPEGFVAATEYAGNHWFDPVVFKGYEMPFNHGAVFTAEFAGLVGYFGGEDCGTEGSGTRGQTTRERAPPGGQRKSAAL